MELLKHNNTVIALLNSYPDEVIVDMGEKSISWYGEDRPSFLTVIARKANIGLMNSNVQLTIKGSAVFTANNSQTIAVTTSHLGPLTVPITVNGSGMINVFVNLIAREEDR